MAEAHPSGVGDDDSPFEEIGNAEPKLASEGATGGNSCDDETDPVSITLLDLFKYFIVVDYSKLFCSCIVILDRIGDDLFCKKTESKDLYYFLLFARCSLEVFVANLLGGHYEALNSISQSLRLASIIK